MASWLPDQCWQWLEVKTTCMILNYLAQFWQDILARYYHVRNLAWLLQDRDMIMYAKLTRICINDLARLLLGFLRDLAMWRHVSLTRTCINDFARILERSWDVDGKDLYGWSCKALARILGMWMAMTGLEKIWGIRCAIIRVGKVA